MNASEVLIDLAQDRYPIGTVAKSALTGTEFTSSGSFIVNEDNSIYSLAKQGAFSVYDARIKKWAEVVEQYKKGAPAFCMVSHDGVNLDIFEKCFCVDKYDMKPVETTMKVGIREAVEIGENVVFSTREAAEKWISEQKPKSILEGKVAIQVNNEREFRLLMEHYSSKGWKWNTGTDPLLKDISFTFPNAIKYHDLIRHSTADDNYRIIPFSDFAAEVGIKVPVFVMNDFHGLPLYDGDNSWVPQMDESDQYTGEVEDFSVSIHNAHDKSIRFSTKEDAERFISIQKPKEIKIELFAGKTAILTKEGVQVTEISSSTKSIWLTPSDIEDLSHNYSVLQQ